MEFLASLSDSTYGVGELHQHCDACRWWQRGHRCEILRCPQCGHALPPPWGLEFGGLFVERVIKGGFMLHDNQDRCVRWSELDVPDTLRFAARHWRHGNFGVLGKTGRLASGTGRGEEALNGRFRFVRI